AAFGQLLRQRRQQWPIVQIRYLMTALQAQALIGTAQIETTGDRLAQKPRIDRLTEQPFAVLIAEITNQFIQRRLQLWNIQLRRPGLHPQQDGGLPASSQRNTQLQVTLHLPRPAPALQWITCESGQWGLLHQLQTVLQWPGKVAADQQLHVLLRVTPESHLDIVKLGLQQLPLRLIDGQVGVMQMQRAIDLLQGWPPVLEQQAAL